MLLLLNSFNWVFCFSSNIIMARQETWSTFEKKMLSLKALIRRYVALTFIAALLVSYTFMEIAVLSVMMDYLTEILQMQNQRVAAIVINLGDALSSLFFVVVSLISQTYTGSFTMITFCAAASIEVNKFLIAYYC
ncbi:hypothetical protein VIGAN_09061600 [Vigna angularis var. angularis]|uniref:Uncharacterized protein n=1 Tax=Vigna angularis var. angularis TaxID=157739 RepID=A0A0S3SWI8_PHAAN|nr:uncharacterized protein LOC128194135 [Vigna angularis]BAT97232.1 hypothetical protein VIGAN_09061600 [Vigna angularis var. angularis]